MFFRTSAGLLFVGLLVLSLPSIWASVISQQMTEALLSVESYRGTVEQRGLLPDAPKQAVRQEVTFRKPWKLRVETLSPERYAGSLFLYDGEQLTLWWPHQLYGVRVKGLPTPPDIEIAEHVENEVQHALNHYAFARQKNGQVAGHEVARWRMLPLDSSMPFRLDHTTWNYEPYALPLKMQFQKNGEDWYSFEYRDISFNDSEISDSNFQFEFPRNALVTHWDMRREGEDLDSISREMNFNVLQATQLPEGHTRKKAIRPEGCLPMVAIDYSRDATVLTLTQSRAYHPDQIEPYGKPVNINGHTGWISFAGPYTILYWTQGNTLLTLISNLSFPQAIQVARSVKAV